MNTDIYFISGIDTDAGKSYCTAWYAKQLSQNGQRVITQKFIQTGNTGHSEDIDLHRRIMGTGYLPEDKELARRYDIVLVEGAGGLMVPLTEEYLTIDYIAEKNYPLIFVTSGKLGSINHTLLSLEAVKHRGITLDTVLYNLYPTVEDTTIQNDTMQYIRDYLARHFPETKFEVVPEINNPRQAM